MSDTAAMGVVSFTVIRNTSGNIATAINNALGLDSAHKLSTTPGVDVKSLTGGNALDNSAKFVYLYQVVNIATTSPSLEQLKVKNPAAFTSAGYLNLKVFNDGSDVGYGGNKGVGTDPSADDALDHEPSNDNQSFASGKGISKKPTTTSTDPANPSTSDLSSGGDGDGFVTFHFDVPTIKVGKTSTVVLLTSNFGPIYDAGIVHDSKFSSDGDIPTALTPEPGSLVLCGLGVSFLGFYGWRRRGLKAQPAVA